MKLLQFHGFGSIGQNNTAKWLRESFPDLELILPDLPVNPARSISLGLKLITQHRGTSEGLVVWGTSLGGFYALLAHVVTGIPAVLVNPSLRPWQNLEQRVGDQTNYYTGKPFEWLEAYNAALECFGQTIDTLPLSPDRLLVIVGEQDDVVHPEPALSYFSSRGVQPIILPKQGHRIEKDKLPVIQIRDFFDKSLQLSSTHTDFKI